MVAAPVNNEETQILDSDSPSIGDPETRFDGAERNVVGGVDVGDGDLVKESGVLYGETQALDDSEGSGGDGDFDVGDWGKTQLIEESEEDAAADDDENDEGTAVLSADEGLSDDGATPGGNERKAEEDAELGLETAKDENLSSGDGKDENLVDSDASTDDEEGGEGSLQRRLSSVRVASIRSSALAAAQNFLSKSRNTDSRSTCSNDSTNKTQGNTIDHSHEFTQCYSKEGSANKSKSNTVKKLFYDVTPQEEESTSKMESTHLPAIGHGIAGLSYVGSQEPGDLSQANALEVVDKFISINDFEPSQEALNRGKAAVLKSPPISSAKGVRFLAEKVDHVSPVGKEGIFDWVDSLEDEGGGEFFHKRKEFFFKSKVDASKSQSHPPKNRSGIYDKSGKEDDASPNTGRKLANLAHSDSRLLIQNTGVSKRIHQTKTKRNLSKDLDEQSNSKSLEKQVEGNYDIGPDTQMAAEAIQILVHGSPIRHTAEGDKQCGDMNGNDNSARVKDSSKNVSRRKRSRDSKGIPTRSKRIKMLSSKSDDKRPIISSENLRGSRRKRSLEGKTLETETNRMKSNLKGEKSSQLEFIPGEYRVYGSPIAHRTRHSKQANSKKKVETSSVKVRNCCTRSSKKVNLVKQAEILCNGSEKYGNEMMDDTCKAAGTEVELVTNEPGSVNNDNKCSNSNKDQPKVVDTISTKPVTATQPSKKTKRVFIRSVSEILDRVKRKKRSSSTMRASEDIRSILPGLRTRSSVHSLLVTHSSGKNSNQPTCTPSLDKAGSAGSPNEKVRQSSIGRTTSKVVEEVSPICVTQGPSRAWDKGLSRPSIARELLRLEPPEASPNKEWKDLRRRKYMASTCILLSHHLDDDIIKQQKKILARLGVSVAASISDASHFVADKFVRTRNMLEAMALGKPVVTPLWLEACGQASCFIDEKNYILRDTKKEKEIGFSMPGSLARACQCALLQGKRVFITANVKPSQELIASLVKAAGGQPMERIGRSVIKDEKVPDDLLIISSEEDYDICIPLLEKDAGIFSSELVLNGIVIQKLEYERHRLFSNHIKRTRSTLWLRNKDDGQFLPVNKCS
ncbi:dentin sialophosphoprotein [Ananas comosus]|uniref:Dentin sialophosphoprotein n=1 Tax=Ananas comosus TaxID=4615 RepID=A0A6P5FZK3_ANACO|nr:dentin sialophosphoprotein [Ananas comosus]